VTVLPLWPDGHPELANPASGFIPTLTHYPAHDTLAGAVIVAPGGGYQNRAPHEGEPIARWLNSVGIHAFVLDYRVAPHKHPEPLHDAQRAIRIVRHRASEWNIRPDRIGILGFSAGGHLAGSAGTVYDTGNPAASDPIERESSRPDAMVLCYGVLSMMEITHGGSLKNLLGEDAPEELRASLSAELQVNASTPPAFIWHTADDASVPVEHSLRMASALARNGIEFALHVYPHGRHGLGLAEELPEVATWTGHCAAFLTDLGYATQQE
jgi:acetyl esterase/lipase